LATTNLGVGGGCQTEPDDNGNDGSCVHAELHAAKEGYPEFFAHDAEFLPPKQSCCHPREQGQRLWFYFQGQF
jgi:hypothetical protein